MKNLEQHGDWLAAQKLELAARNLSHLLKIHQEQTSLENIVGSLQQTMIDTDANDPRDLCDMMTVQARILDGVFHRFLDDAHGKYTSDDKIAFAMKAQAQTVRTAMAWKRLKTETQIKHKFIRYYGAEKNPHGTK